MGSINVLSSLSLLAGSLALGLTFATCPNQNVILKRLQQAGFQGEVVKVNDYSEVNLCGITIKDPQTGQVVNDAFYVSTNLQFLIGGLGLLKIEPAPLQGYKALIVKTQNGQNLIGFFNPKTGLFLMDVIPLQELIKQAQNQNQKNPNKLNQQPQPQPQPPNP